MIRVTETFGQPIFPPGAREDCACIGKRPKKESNYTHTHTHTNCHRKLLSLSYFSSVPVRISVVGWEQEGGWIKL